MHIAELKREVDAVKEQLKGMVCEKVLVETLQSFGDRLTAIENRLTAAGV